MGATMSGAAKIIILLIGILIVVAGVLNLLNTDKCSNTLVTDILNIILIIVGSLLILWALWSLAYAPTPVVRDVEIKATNVEVEIEESDDITFIDL